MIITSSLCVIGKKKIVFIFYEIFELIIVLCKPNDGFQ